MDMHPIVARMSPSDEQAPAVLARDRNVVVTAGAGTGKTRTLVARYLSLLAEGHPVRSILAITFTRKAAREMRNRVRDQIRRYLEPRDLDEGERQEWQDRYIALDAARIGTIHSFCSEILRAHPAEAGVDPRFQTLEEGQANILLGRAVDEAMAWAADEPGVVELFALLGERGLRSTLESLVRQRLDAEQVFERLPRDLLAHWQQALLERQDQRLAALVRRPEWSDAMATLQDNAADRPDDRMEVQRQAALAALESPAESLAERLETLSRLDDIDLRGGSMKAWPGGREQLADIKAALRALREMWKGQASLLELSLTPQDEALAAAMPALHVLFRRAVAIYHRFKEERQALDYDDLEHGALALLEGDLAVRARWQDEFQGILVDEFQDTNARQRDLVALLNSGGKLFIVGDAKQSIYRFRGADVVVFRQEREQIEREDGQPLSLATSYRAHRELIEALNSLLRPVLGLDADPDRPWAEPFAPLSPHRQEAGAGFTAPHIELHLTVGAKGDGALDRAANALAGRIEELMDGGLQVVDGDRSRALDYGDFAILCRASRSFAAYEDALEQAGVPFLTVAGRGFYGRPEIRDILNVLQAVADPTDNLTLAGLLRSPAFALSDAALYHLCGARNRAEGASTLWDTLQTMPSALSVEEQRRARRAVRFIEELHAQVGRTSVADVLKAFLDSTDYRAALIQAGETRAARNVSKLLADAHVSGIVGVGEFLEYLDGLRDSGTREGEARSTMEGAVQIMTVHAAKGLEFPVVILGDVTRSGGRGGSLLVDPELGPLLPVKDNEGQTPAMYRLGKMQSDDQEDAESDRLLYVAATRAREKLILSGCISLKQDGTPGKLKGWLAKLAGENGLTLAVMPITHDPEGASTTHLTLHADSTPVACIIYEPGHLWDHRPRQKEEAVELTATVPPPLLAPVSPETEPVDERTSEQDRIPPRRVWRVVPTVKRPRAPAWVVGSLVHEALAAWRFPADSDGHFEVWGEARARGYGLTDHRQLADAVRQSQQLLVRFQAHSLYGEMERADRRLHEVPYSLEVGRNIESGIIDALYVRDGVWTIVEFKTDEVRGQAELERLLVQEDYQAQAQRYLAAAGRLLGEPPRFILCMLNYARAVHLHLLEMRDGA